ncbi:sodium-dependent phosphate transporter 1-A-like [Lineus longissimus]|uniref:sodium-dependent phosphate transporter 1-A-like n=1 Tax=Lineus longissimus TaxID=88925 RepID=UPI002B4F8221
MTSTMTLSSNLTTISTTSYSGGIPTNEVWMITTGFVIAFILAFGIGANDVANSFGTSVGAKVLTLIQACILATIFETAGALLLGTKVSDTIRKGIVDVASYENDHKLFMVGQISALIGACVWLLIATFFRLPVSGTHSIVGAILGFGLVAHGANGIYWEKIGMIVGSWLISPLLAGAVSVFIFYIVRKFILEKADCLQAGLVFLPFIYAITITINTFSIFYDGPKMLGFDKIPLYGTFILSFGCGLITGLVVFFAVVPWQRKHITDAVAKHDQIELEERKETIDEVVETRTRSGSVMTITQAVCNPVIRRSSVSAVSATDSSHCDRPGPGRHRRTISDAMYHSEAQASVHARSKFRRQRSAPDTRHLVRFMSYAVKEEDIFESGDSALNRDITPQCNGHEDNQRFSLPGIQYSSIKATAAVDVGARQDLKPETAFSNISPVLTDDEEEEKVQIFSKGIQVDTFDLEDKTIKVKEGRQEIKDKPEASMLFSFLQILTAVFGSFAHGGNDVSNAIGPLIALWTVSHAQSVEQSDPAPIWILLYGSAGISIGLWVWGRRVIKTLGEDLTKITPTSGFCIEIGTALTVLIASNVGIPVSTTHCKVGAVVCTGRFRSRENVDWRVFRNIVFAWIVTLPMSGGIAAGAFAALRLILE